MLHFELIFSVNKFEIRNRNGSKNYSLVNNLNEYFDYFFLYLLLLSIIQRNKRTYFPLKI